MAMRTYIVVGMMIVTIIDIIKVNMPTIVLMPVPRLPGIPIGGIVVPVPGRSPNGIGGSIQVHHHGPFRYL